MKPTTVVKIKAHVLHPDPFVPVLLSSESLIVSLEQRELIKEILRAACSDSRFAEKAYDAILYTLTAGSVIPIGLTSLTPSTAIIGSESFTLHVMGENFDQYSVINFAGHDEPTTFVNSTELTTGVDMSVWHGADVLPVVVKSPVLVTDPLMFTFMAPAGTALQGNEGTGSIPPISPIPHPTQLPSDHTPHSDPVTTYEGKKK
jgi:hypothetical protein